MINYYGQNNPYYTPVQQEQQQQNPLSGLGTLSQLQSFSGAGAGAGAGLGSGASAGSVGGSIGGGAGAGLGSGVLGGAGAGGALGGAGAGASGGGASAGGAALASNPIGWVVAAAIGQSILDREGISTFGAGLKGQGGRNTGDHFLEQWGANEGPTRQLAGLAGWGKGAGLLNPGNLAAKIFGEAE